MAIPGDGSGLRLLLGWPVRQFRFRRRNGPGSFEYLPRTYLLPRDRSEATRALYYCFYYYYFY